MTPSHLTLSDLKGQSQGRSDFEVFLSCKGAELGHMLLLNFNRNAYRYI